MPEYIDMPFAERQEFYYNFYMLAYGAWGENARNETRAIMVQAVHLDTLRRHEGQTDA